MFLKKNLILLLLLYGISGNLNHYLKQILEVVGFYPHVIDIETIKGLAVMEEIFWSPTGNLCL